MLWYMYIVREYYCTARKFNWWCYCLALFDEIFVHYPLFVKYNKIRQRFSDSVRIYLFGPVTVFIRIRISGCGWYMYYNFHIQYIQSQFSGESGIGVWMILYIQLPYQSQAGNKLDNFYHVSYHEINTSVTPHPPLTTLYKIVHKIFRLY